MGDLLTSEQAASALGVTRATLYSYISRGFLQSVSSPGEYRRKRYSRTDVELLKAKKDGLRNPLKSASESLRFGLPVLETKITLIRDGRLFYRGHDATVLAREDSLEQVAELLWDVNASEKKPELKLWQRVPRLPSGSRARSIAELQIMLARLGSRDSNYCELHGTALLKTGAQIVQALAGALAGNTVPGMSCHERLGFAWSPGNAEAPRALRVALVLAADHELNASTFVARCAAAAGASPIDVVIAALSTLNGRRHGGQTAKAAQVFVEAEQRGSVTRLIAQRLRTGDAIPAFGHPLYPNGDPRADLLLENVLASGDKARRRLVRELRRAGSRATGEAPNLDFALGALEYCHKLPAGSGLAVFALGRSVGWLAHAFEQYSSGELIRPRAKYTGNQAP
jgi:citrate synthase